MYVTLIEEAHKKLSVQVKNFIWQFNVMQIELLNINFCMQNYQS